MEAGRPGRSRGDIVLLGPFGVQTGTCLALWLQVHVLSLGEDRVAPACLLQCPLSSLRLGPHPLPLSSPLGGLCLLQRRLGQRVSGGEALAGGISSSSLTCHLCHRGSSCPSPQTWGRDVCEPTWSPLLSLAGWWACLIPMPLARVSWHSPTTKGPQATLLATGSFAAFCHREQRASRSSPRP